MTATLHLRDITSGADVTRDIDWDDSMEFYLSDGNMGCDCNRAKYFGITDHPCTDKRFVAWVDVDGRTVYDERERGAA